MLWKNRQEKAGKFAEQTNMTESMRNVFTITTHEGGSLEKRKVEKVMNKTARD